MDKLAAVLAFTAQWPQLTAMALLAAAGAAWITWIDVIAPALVPQASIDRLAAVMRAGLGSAEAARTARLYEEAAHHRCNRAEAAIWRRVRHALRASAPPPTPGTRPRPDPSLTAPGPPPYIAAASRDPTARGHGAE